MKELLEFTRLCVDVAVPLPVSGLFIYAADASLQEKIKIGARVLIPFKNREMVGYVVGVEMRETSQKLKNIIHLLDEEPVVSGSILALTQWISQRYCCSWGEAIENALPKWVKYGKKAERALSKKTSADSASSYPEKEDFVLTADQENAMKMIREAMNISSPAPILLHGVTGSGKSEIYIRAIREVLSHGKTAICLVPEIALTEQLRHFFVHHFGARLEILHSKLNDTERFLAWKRLESGERSVVLGPRSAVFAPLNHLGLIIMDEEHEGSYKQETVPRYHARQVAAWRAQHEGAVFVMGSATPSMESMYRTGNKEYLLANLISRIEERAMPAVQILDLKDHGSPKAKTSILTFPLAAEIEKNLSKKEGTLLLLNRRGFSTHIHCPRCGESETCQACQISLTFHQEDGMLLCHYCNFSKPVPELCGNCKTPVLRFSGFGTEKVESEVARRWPTARIARMDADSVRRKGSHEKILKEFRDRKVDILIGTQMIAKGFDFPHVTLVGVILADVGLMLPDFRSGERTFQLLTQVAGRAGRGSSPGRVLIQTYSPDHPSIRFAKEHDYLSFYKHEMPSRYRLQYPPYQQLTNIIVRSKDEKRAYLFARELRDLLKQELAIAEAADPAQAIQIIGPSPLPFYKLRGHFRWHVMIKSPREAKIYEKISQILPKQKKSTAVAMAVDIDPVNIL